MPKIDNRSGPFDPGLLALDRQRPRNLSEQIQQEIRAAILSGKLQPGARLPSCRDLAAQLGVARGTVRQAYDLLTDIQLLVAKGAAGTFVSDHLPASPVTRLPTERSPLKELVYGYDTPALIFQMGVPASDSFPAKVWSRLFNLQSRQLASAPACYPDPRGSLLLRQELSAYLALTRGIHCSPSQILLTQGYAGALGLIMMVLQLSGKRGWMENPGYMLAHKALEMAGITTVPVAVDNEGICVSEGIATAPDAAFALVTAGQQAPSGVTLSPARRQALLHWAQENHAWIIEDDYLGELQLDGRAAPALAAGDTHGRVLHIGTFSKTLSPALRCGYLVLPPALANQFGDAMAAFSPSASPLIQNAIALFMQEGHFLRHLRRMKRVYRERLMMMMKSLSCRFPQLRQAGLAVIIDLPDGSNDRAIAREALSLGMAPSPLSLWYQTQPARSGLLLGVTNMPAGGFELCASQLKDLVDRYR